VSFWDSSAVVPLLVRQTGSSTVDRWLENDPVLVVWSLTPVEVTSALWRLVREGVLSDEAALAAEIRTDELLAASHVVIDVEAAKLRAQRLLRVHELRAADALQLAAALVWAGDQPRSRFLLTLDERLAVAARREGFEVPA
jgi:predicted nucleic acid-binding protein